MASNKDVRPNRKERIARLGFWFWFCGSSISEFPNSCQSASAAIANNEFLKREQLVFEEIEKINDPRSCVTLVSSRGRPIPSPMAVPCVF